MKGNFKIILNNFIPAIFWGIAILVLSGIPGNAFPNIPSFIEWLKPDKIIHIFIYCVFGYLLQSGFTKQYSGKKKRYYFTLFALIFGIIYGAITEIMQFYIFIGRNGNIFDFFANVLGCLAGILIYYLIFSKKNVKNSN